MWETQRAPGAWDGSPGPSSPSLPRLFDLLRSFVCLRVFDADSRIHHTALVDGPGDPSHGPGPTGSGVRLSTQISSGIGLPWGRMGIGRPAWSASDSVAVIPR